MLRLFRRAPVTRAGRRTRVHLRLESLSDRTVPTGDLVPVYGAEPAPVGDGQPPANQTPEIVGFTAEAVGDGWWRVSGRVVDERPGGLVVTFGGGVASLAGKTVTTNAAGEFSYLVLLNTDGTDTGWVSATTEDDLGADADPVYAYCDP